MADKDVIVKAFKTVEQIHSRSQGGPALAIVTDELIRSMGFNPEDYESYAPGLRLISPDDFTAQDL